MYQRDSLIREGNVTYTIGRPRPRIWQPSARLSATWLVQSVYFLVTGIWPLVHMRSFITITGPKTDLWLVKTVGVLVTVIGLALSLSWLRRHRISDPEIPLLAAGSAAALAAVDVVYVSKGRISPIYLLDALAELVFIVLWLTDWRRIDHSSNVRR